ncbi:MarR family transcriptional regulator [Sporosarcina sp. BI001-red]|uniref:MarR family winged helix-turn-helix transcriptional regulator n=1 Tax=Sporosarcina sp. BI001-red TaxID=2282866 RepID=UPI000E22DB98|nr:MarR family transcriptional regulator [Sporosarcina sp. BI001-red]REB07422.1 MarR family transcriptional regulator [Sporosarcina sp. BI001-red]
MSERNKTDFVRFEELFWNVTREMGRMWKQVFEEHLPGSQSHLVFTLARKGPLKMSELAQILGLTAGAVTAASDKLMNHGYVTRIRDESDRRIVHLAITDEGREMLQQLRAVGRTKMSEAFSHLDEGQLPMMIEVFEQAAVNISIMKGNE